MFLRKTFAVALAGAIAMLASQANGDILFTTGAMTEITAPVSFATGDEESSTSIAILDEGITVLASDVELNVYGVGVHGDDPPPYLVVPAGTRVQSYLVHFDPIGGGFATATGAVFFEPGEIIIGIQTHTPLLYTTDGPLGHPLTTYPGVFDAFRGFETLPGTDTVTLPPGMGSASFTLFAELGVDHARIITSPVIPEPASIVLLAAALIGMGRLSRRR